MLSQPAIAALLDMIRLDAPLARAAAKAEIADAARALALDVAAGRLDPARQARAAAAAATG